MDAARPDFEKYDSELQIVERGFRSLCERQEVRQPSIERWRWDVAMISLQWTPSDDVSRNINASVDRKRPRAMNFEVNAWQDVDRPRGTNRVRYWRHEELKSLPMPLDADAVGELLEDAYRRVSGWTFESMQQKTELTPWPE
jgi:hypothetical protein